MPLLVYGSSISYFTGKLEGYLRYKEIPYQLVPMTPLVRAKVGRRTGTPQMPAVELPEGRWMTDTTPMIGWFESQHPEPAVISRDPLQAFASRLLEDYADEWLWRPALHYRWSYRGDALLLSRRIVDEMMPRVPVPGAWKRFGIRQRQLGRYVRGDGVTAATREHVEGVYLRSLGQLAAIFASRPVGPLVDIDPVIGPGIPAYSSYGPTEREDPADGSNSPPHRTMQPSAVPIFGGSNARASGHAGSGASRWCDTSALCGV